MKCCICGGEIEKLYAPDGSVAWDKGNNAEPLKKGRCCGACNEVVIATRLYEVKLREKDRTRTRKRVGEATI